MVLYIWSSACFGLAVASKYHVKVWQPLCWLCISVISRGRQASMGCTAFRNPFHTPTTQAKEHLIGQWSHILKFGRYRSIVLPPTMLSLKLWLLLLYLRIFAYLIYFETTFCFLVQYIPLWCPWTSFRTSKPLSTPTRHSGLWTLPATFIYYASQSQQFRNSNYLSKKNLCPAVHDRK